MYVNTLVLKNLSIVCLVALDLSTCFQIKGGFDPNPQYTVHYTVNPLNKDMLKEEYREKVFYHSVLYVG
jgi:hypothetical protein